MAGTTYEELWRRLRIYAPALPVSECQAMVRDSYRRILDYPDEAWSFQFGWGQFICHDAIYGTASVTQLSNIITVTALSQGTIPGNNTTIVGRQLLFGGQAPIFSVVSNPDATTIWLDLPYGGPTGSVNFEISNVYFTPDYAHSDYERLIAITDPPNNWQLPFDIHVEELDNEDPQRSSVGTPWLLADVAWNYQYLAQLPSGVTDSFGYTKDSDGIPRKEFWPRQTSQYVFPYVYKRRMPDLKNSNDKPAGFIRGDVIWEGALAAACMWPGTATVPNLMFNPVNHNTHEKRFQNMLHDIRVIDAGVIERSLTWLGTMQRLRFPPQYYSARFIQNHVSLPMEMT